MHTSVILGDAFAAIDQLTELIGHATQARHSIAATPTVTSADLADADAIITALSVARRRAVAHAAAINYPATAVTYGLDTVTAATYGRPGG